MDIYPSPGDIYKVEIENLKQTWNESWGTYQEADISFSLNDEEVVPHWKKFLSSSTNLYQFIHCEGINVNINLNKSVLDNFEAVTVDKLNILNYNKYNNLLEKVSNNNTTVVSENSINVNCLIPKINKIVFGIKKEIILGRQEVEYYELHDVITQLSINTGETDFRFSFIGDEITSELIRDKRVYDNYLFEISGNKLSLNIKEALNSLVFKK